MRTVFHLPFHCRGDVDPVNSEAGGRGIGGEYIARRDAGGDKVECEVVDIGIP